MMYEVIQTNDGFMVLDKYTGDYISDEHGDNLFDSEHEAQKLMTIARMQEAIINMFEAVEEGDAESISHLALQYKRLFITKGETT
jgi:hypothetical protein